VFYSEKLFKGYIFCFLGQSTVQYIFELFARETNLMKKHSVGLCWDKINIVKSDLIVLAQMAPMALQ
jgi:hypothetical protein